MCTGIRDLFHRHIFAASIFPQLHILYFLPLFIPYFCIVQFCMYLCAYSFVFVFLACPLLIIMSSIVVVQPYLRALFFMLMAQVSLIHSLILYLIYIRFFIVLCMFLIYIYIVLVSCVSLYCIYIVFSTVLYCTLFGVLYFYHLCVLPIIFLCICFYIYGLSTVECYSCYLCVYLLLCVSLTSPGVYFVEAFFYFVYIHLFYINFSTFFVNGDLF